MDSYSFTDGSLVSLGYVHEGSLTLDEWTPTSTTFVKVTEVVTLVVHGLT